MPPPHREDNAGEGRRELRAKKCCSSAEAGAPRRVRRGSAGGGGLRGGSLWRPLRWGAGSAGARAPGSARAHARPGARAGGRTGVLARGGPWRWGEGRRGGRDALGGEAGAAPRAWVARCCSGGGKRGRWGSGPCGGDRPGLYISPLCKPPSGFRGLRVRTRCPTCCPLLPPSPPSPGLHTQQCLLPVRHVKL